MKTGRAPSITASVWPDVFRLHREGFGSIRIAGWLMSQGIAASKSSVGRLLLKRPPYGAGPE